MENIKKERALVSDIYSSRVYIAVNKTIAADTRFKESEGKGMINQILLRSNSTAYRLYVLIDNKVAYDFPYSFFASHTADIDNISAYTAGGIYYLTIQNLMFQKNFQLKIATSTSIIFSLLQVRYQIIDEIIKEELV